MDDAALVRVVNGVADCHHQQQRLPGIQVARSDILRRRLPVRDELHREEGLHTRRRGRGAHFIHLGDAGVVQSRQCVRLLLETPQEAGTGQ